MKSIRWILASMTMGLLAAACTVPTESSEAEAEAETETKLAPEAQPDDSGSHIFTTYYSTAAKTTEVGYCVISTCPPKGTTCSGTKTSFTKVMTLPCSY